MLVGTSEPLLAIERGEVFSSKTINMIFYTNGFIQSELRIFRNIAFVVYYFLAAAVVCLFDGVTPYYIIPSSLIWINCLMWLSYFGKWVGNCCDQSFFFS